MSDYLWDKKGSDEEIEKLETSLRVFSSDSNEPLLNSEVASESWFSGLSAFWKLAPALASCVVLGFVLLSPTAFEDTENPGSQIVAGTLGGTVFEKSADSASPKPDLTRPEEVSVPVQTASARVKKRVVRRVSKVSRRSPAAGRKTMPKRQPKARKAVISPGDPITPEERAAFEELKKALAITSSNLSILKEKVNGDDEELSSDIKE